MNGKMTSEILEPIHQEFIRVILDTLSAGRQVHGSQKNTVPLVAQGTKSGTAF
jgi:hypothetical protein